MEGVEYMARRIEALARDAAQLEHSVEQANDAAMRWLELLNDLQSGLVDYVGGEASEFGRRGSSQLFATPMHAGPYMEGEQVANAILEFLASRGCKDRREDAKQCKADVSADAKRMIEERRRAENAPDVTPLDSLSVSS